MNKKITESAMKSLAKGMVADGIIRDTELSGFFAEKKKKGIYFYYRFRTADGQRTTEKIGEFGPLTVDAAREVVRLKAGDIAKGFNPVEEKRKDRKQREVEKKRKTSLESFIDGEYKDITRDNTCRDVKGRVRKHFPKLMQTPLDEITAAPVIKWQTAFTGAPSTCNRVLAALRGVLTKAKKLGYITDHPLIGVKPVTAENADKAKLVIAISDEDEELIIEALERRQDMQREQGIVDIFRRRKLFGKNNPTEPRQGKYTDYLLPMFLLALRTGCRIAENYNLKWRDVDFNAQVLTIVGAGEKDSKTDVTGSKSGKTREVDLNETAINILIEWRTNTAFCRDDDFVFANWDGSRLYTVRYEWELLRESVGLKIKWHQLRHTFGTRLAESTNNVRLIQDFMGHADVKTTLNYLKPDRDSRKRAVDSLN